jgi:hypothetical protein
MQSTSPSPSTSSHDDDSAPSVHDTAVADGVPTAQKNPGGHTSDAATDRSRQ